MNRTCLLLILYILLGVNTSSFANNYIVVSKQKLMLFVVSPQQDTLCAINCAVGTNYGKNHKHGHMISMTDMGIEKVPTAHVFSD